MGCSAMNPRRPYVDLRSPTLGLRRETCIQAHEIAEVDQGIRDLSEGAENSVSGVLDFICQYFSL